MLIHDIREIKLPQNGRGFDKLEKTRVLKTFLGLFANSHIRVKLFLQKFRWNSNFDNALLVEEYSNDEETRKKVIHLATARKLALEGKLQTPPKSDCKDRETGLRAFNPERCFQSLPPIRI